MTQLDTGAEAPAVASAPEPSQAPVAAPTTSDDAFIRVPKDQLGAWDGRFGEVISRAKTHDEYADWFPMLSEMRANFKTPQEFVDYYNGLHASATPPNTPPATETPPEPKFLTEERFSALLEERDKTRTASDKKAQAQEAADAVYTKASAEEDKLVSDVLTGLKAEPDSFTGRIATATLQSAINRAVRDRLLKALPSFATDGDKAKVMSEISKTPSTAADRKAAREMFVNDWKDLANNHVASFAEDNQDATATLGAGPGGPQDPLDTSNMDPEEWDAMSRQEKKAMSIRAFNAAKQRR